MSWRRHLGFVAALVVGACGGGDTDPKEAGSKSAQASAGGKTAAGAKVAAGGKAPATAEGGGGHPVADGGAPAKPDGPPTAATPDGDTLAHEVIIVDGHIDVPWRLEKSRAKDGTITEDVSKRTAGGDFDFPRARAGGLDAPFMSIYVAPRFEGKGAKKLADELIGLVEGIAAASPDSFALARTPADVRTAFAAGKVSLPMGMENGAPIEGDLANVQYFFDRGIRYITLAHSKDNHISDSSYDDRHTNGGLSDFGREVVAEMNRVGIMVDVSHLSDEAFEDVIEVSTSPVIASHSSCRHFTPGWERNMSDAMMEKLAAGGGVIMINFGTDFLDAEVKKARKAHDAKRSAHLQKLGHHPDSKLGHEAADAYDAEHPPPVATLARVADHIEHAIAVVGIDHVGLGSDFDGVGDTLPLQLHDASMYPNLLDELARRGHDRPAIAKIAGQNALRVWQEVLDYEAPP